ncbi:MAG: hypothetical protein ACOX8W_11530 [bacterium]
MEYYLLRDKMNDVRESAVRFTGIGSDGATAWLEERRNGTGAVPYNLMDMQAG